MKAAQIIRRLFIPKPCPLALKLAADRDAMAEACATQAVRYAGLIPGIQYADEARQWRDAADRARRGDLSPIRLV